MVAQVGPKNTPERKSFIQAIYLVSLGAQSSLDVSRKWSPTTYGLWGPTVVSLVNYLWATGSHRVLSLVWMNFYTQETANGCSQWWTVIPSWSWYFHFYSRVERETTRTYVRTSFINDRINDTSSYQWYEQLRCRTVWCTTLFNHTVFE